MRPDYKRLFELGSRYRSAFLAAKPFPNVVIDSFFEAEVYSRIANAFPSPDHAIWKKPETAHTRGKSVTKRGKHDLKDLLFSEESCRVFFELNSGPFLRFLETLTGITGLIGDPYYAEAGFHCSEDGGYLDIHADFSHHDHLGLERRLNLLLYLNDDWQPAYGGALSLYDEQLRIVQTFLPIGNRAVVFATSNTSYHGHPEPMHLPAGVYRRSIALYYYTLPTGRDRSRIIFPEDRGFTHTPTSS